MIYCILGCSLYLVGGIFRIIALGFSVIIICEKVLLNNKLEYTVNYRNSIHVKYKLMNSEERYELVDKYNLQFKSSKLDDSLIFFINKHIKLYCLFVFQS